MKVNINDNSYTRNICREPKPFLEQASGPSQFLFQQFSVTNFHLQQ